MKGRGMSIFLLFAIVLALTTIVTVLPRSSAKKVSLLGYRALCSFSPISTIILGIPALIFVVLWLVL
jgi:hypothetical protein